MRTTRVVLSLLALLVVGASSALAARVAIGVSGSSTGNGTVDIIIQDNDDPNRVASERRALWEIDVVILAGSTASMSAQTVRDTLDLELPPFYEVTIFEATTIVIEQPGPIVAFDVADNVPGQVFQEVQPPGSGRRAPIAPVTLAIAALGMAAIAARRLRRR